MLTCTYRTTYSEGMTTNEARTAALTRTERTALLLALDALWHATTTTNES